MWRIVLCTECQGPTVAFSSLRFRVCLDCSCVFEWELDDNERPLVMYQR